MTSSDDAAIPPDVLAVFLELKRHVDGVLDALQQPSAARKELAVNDSVALLDTASLSLRAHDLTITVEDVRRARAWLRTARAPGAFVAGVYADAIGGRIADGTLDRLGDLLDLAERWLS